MYRLLFIVFCLGLPILSPAQDSGLFDEPQSKIQGLMVFSDQDFFNDWVGLAPNLDRNYTMSAGFRWFGGKSTGRYNPLRYPLKGLEKAFSLENKKYTFLNSSLTLGYSAFTPEDLYYTHPVVNDRPYAGILYLQAQRTYESEDQNKGWIFTSSLGLLGTQIGKKFQGEVHYQRLKNNPKSRPVPRGWHNQISNGGEPSAFFSVQRRWELLGKDEECLHYSITNSASMVPPLKLQVFAYSEASGGWYTGVMQGISFRVGYITNHFLQEDNIGYGVSHANLSEDKRFKNWNAYFFTNLRGRLWLYNGLLMGQFRDSNHSFSWSEIQPATLEFDAGIRVSWSRFTLAWVIISGRSPEFRGNLAAWQYWGGLSAGYMF